MKNISKVSAVAVLAAAIGAGFTLAWTDSPQGGATSGATTSSSAPTCTSASAPTSRGTGLNANFYGTQTPTDDVVFVIDRSGSMMETMDSLKAEIIRSISALDASQNMHIVFFHAGKPLEMEPSGLKPATDENKAKAVEFVKSMSVEGNTNPANAIKRAMDTLAKSNNPNKTIYLVTDAAFDDPKAVLAVIKAGKKNKIVINTYLYGAKPTEDAEKIMQDIANDSGGRYKWVEAE